jgi:hypothetical protein
MTSIEEFLAKRITFYTLLGLALRFILYNLDGFDPISLYVVLSACVGVGGGLLSLGQEYNRRKYQYLGLVLIVIGLLPLHYLL